MEEIVTIRKGKPGRPLGSTNKPKDEKRVCSPARIQACLVLVAAFLAGMFTLPIIVKYAFLFLGATSSEAIGASAGILVLYIIAIGALVCMYIINNLFD